MPIMSKVLFMETDMMLDEACRQWFAFIQEDTSRADGVGFGQFYRQLSDEMYRQYRENPEDFDFHKSKYPVFISLNEDEATRLAEELSDHVGCVTNRNEAHPLKSVFDKLSEQINTEERMVMKL